MEEDDKLDITRLKAYAGDVAKIASAVNSIMKTDGWQIFLALWLREKNAIKEKKSYPAIEDFNADRKAIDIFEGILETFKGYIADAKEAEELLDKLISSDSQTPNKGVLILDSLEEHGKEQG